MGLAYRIAAGFLALLVVLVAVAAYHLTVIHRLRSDIDELAGPTVALEEESAEIRIALHEIKSLSEKLPVYRVAKEVQELTEGEGAAEETEVLADEDLLEGLVKRRAEISGRIGKLQEHLQFPEEVEAFEALQTVWADYRRRVGDLERRAAEQSPKEADPTLLVLARDLSLVRQAHGSFQESSRRLRRESAETSEEEAREAELVAQVAAILALVATLIASLLVSASVVRPLRRLTRGTRALAEGDFSYRVAASGSAELVRLAADFNAMAERLSILDQLKKDLVSNVSHDLKAPLASMQETTRLLLDRIPGELTTKQERILQMNLSCGERLSKMISDLLDLSRLESQAHLEPFAPEDLRPLFATALEELELLIQEKRLLVHRDLPEHPVEISCHGPSILQALQNLVSNAVKFSPPESQLGVRIWELAPSRGSWWRRPSLPLPADRKDDLQNGVLLEVWDSGPGVPEDQKERIFDRFHRGDPDRKGQQGTGLGLAIARAIVERHRGALWVENREKVGSRFRIVLPKS